MGTRYVAQADLELLASNDLPALASPSAEITGISHPAQRFIVVVVVLLLKKIF